MTTEQISGGMISMSEDRAETQRAELMQKRDEVARELAKRSRAVQELRAQRDALRAKLEAQRGGGRVSAGDAALLAHREAYRVSLKTQLSEVLQALTEAEAALVRADERLEMINDDLAGLDDDEGSTRA